MIPAYFETHFRTDSPIDSWPDQFAIITGFATTGESWSDDRNHAADQQLLAQLTAAGHQPIRITGFSPLTHHSEASWAVPMDWPAACDLGLAFLQDAVYWVDRDALSITYCDDRRALVSVGSFRDRLHQPSSQDR
ncbi:MAG: DUF3293 domain-containing protein [Verrucomicrobiota bacterium]|jgi:hypothetical protein